MYFHYSIHSSQGAALFSSCLMPIFGSWLTIVSKAVCAEQSGRCSLAQVDELVPAAIADMLMGLGDHCVPSHSHRWRSCNPFSLRTKPHTSCRRRCIFQSRRISGCGRLHFERFVWSSYQANSQNSYISRLTFGLHRCHAPVS